MRRPAPIRRLIAAALSLSASGVPACILLLDDTPSLDSEHCHFSGEAQTNCGHCVTTKCQGAVDACCKASKCVALEQLDACAGALDIEACTALRTPTGDTGATNKLRSCVSSSCDAECASPTVIPEIGCYQNTLEGDPPGCRCETDVEASSVAACSEASPAGSRCCADIGWPGNGLQCICRTVGCRQTASGCECSISEQGPETSCTGDSCCADELGCRCGSEACIEGIELSVTSCSAQSLPCLTDTVHVTTCTATP
jgi:hypothetical protein